MKDLMLETIHVEYDALKGGLKLEAQKKLRLTRKEYDQLLEHIADVHSDEDE